MAVPPGLTGRPPLRLALLAVVVLAAHAVALHWIARLQLKSALLQPMVPTLYTRMLEPQAPPPPPAVASMAGTPPSTGRPTASIRPARSTPPTTTTTQAQPPDPEVVAAAPPVPPSPAPTPGPEPIQPQAVAPPAEPPALPPVAAATEAPASAPASTAAVSWPPDTRLRYKLDGFFRGGPLNGDARVLWQRQDTRYQVRVEVEIGFLASLVMTSQGEVGALLQPQVYEELRNGKPRGVRLGEQEVLLANGNVVRKPDGVQDTASQFVELSHRFATGREKLEVGRAVSFFMARPGAVDLWTYDIVQREVLSTRLGPIEAFHLKPRPIANPRGNITAEIWFAPSLQYLPVRIRVNMGEEAQIDLMVEAIDQK